MFQIDIWKHVQKKSGKFLLVGNPASRSKCPNSNETRTQSIALPTRCIYQVSNRYLKTCSKKTQKTLTNPKHERIIAKILKIRFFITTDPMPRCIQWANYVPNLKDLSWCMRPWLQSMSLNNFWLWNRSKWPNCDETGHFISPYECIHQIFKFTSWNILKKVQKTRMDRWTDGWTLPHNNVTVFQTGV